ncbi:MAG: DUF3592 domain-containing protein [Terracidiphilus sp.]
MLIELWEWLRGYHRWTEVDAKIELVKEEHTYHGSGGKDLHYSYAMGDRLVWTDLRGEQHHFDFKLPGDSGKDRLADGEAVTLRYNPANPEQYYCRKLSEMKVRRFFATTFTVIAVAAMSIGYVWVREMLGCSR